MIKRFYAVLSFAFLAVVLCVSQVEAKARVVVPPIVNVVIDVSSQSMFVKVNGWPYGSWKVSTARPGYHTPRGSFGVQRTARVYFSKKYDNAPMPNAVFFHYGFAIHGTYHIKNLGRPASHGCVRISPTNSAQLYGLVQKYGPSATRITIVD
jgi:lipoprotein-anchoring transpeptidase ErfK/SrfK